MRRARELGQRARQAGPTTWQGLNSKLKPEDPAAKRKTMKALRHETPRFGTVTGNYNCKL